MCRTDFGNFFYKRIQFFEVDKEIFSFLTAAVSIVSNLLYFTVNSVFAPELKY